MVGGVLKILDGEASLSQEMVHTFVLIPLVGFHHFAIRGVGALKGLRITFLTSREMELTQYKRTSAPLSHSFVAAFILCKPIAAPFA